MSFRVFKLHGKLVLMVRTTTKSFFTVKCFTAWTFEEMLSVHVSSLRGLIYKCPFDCLLTARAFPYAFGDKQLPLLIRGQTETS